MSERDADNEIDYVRNIVSSVIWNVLYHEERLPIKHRELAFAKIVALRFPEIDLGDTEVENDKDYDPEHAITIEEYVWYLVTSAKSSIQYNEELLKDANRKIPLVKEILAKYPSLDFEELKREQALRLAKANKEDEQ